MARGNARQAGHGQATRRARSPAAEYAPYLDAARIRDDRQALALLASVLSARRGCALLATDPGGTIMAWSEAAAALFGHQPRAVLGRRKWADLVAPGSGGQQRPEPLAAALADGAWLGVLECLRAGGERMTCQVSVSRLGEEDQQPAGTLIVAREAGQDLGRLADLRTDAARALALFADNPAPVIGTDALGVITHANRAAEALFGRPQAALAGTRVSALCASAGQARAALGRALREGAVSDAEFEVTRPDGAAVPVAFTAAARQGPDGRPAGLVATLTDLTERNRSREQLQRSEAYHRGLIEAAGDGLVAVDPSGGVTDVNEPACRLFGYRRDELAGSALADCFAEPGQVMAAITQALAGEPLARTEFMLAAGPGPARHVSLTASVFRSPGSQEPRIILSLHDVTAQVRLRDRLAQERGYNRSIIESSANGLAMIDMRDRISDVNETFCRVTGRSRADLVGADFAGLFTEPDAATAAVHHALASGSTARRDLLLAAGQQQVAVSASLVRSGAGEVMGTLISTRDIAAESLLQRALTAEQAYNRGLVEATLNGLFVVTPEGKITDVNTAACRLARRSRRQLAGRPFAALFAEQEPVRRALVRAFAGGRLPESELVLAAARPERVIVSCSGGVFTDPRGHGQVLLAVMRDISRQRETEDRLRFYTESLFEAIVDALAATDMLGVIVDANRPMEALTGRPLAEMAGHHLDEYFTEPERAREFMATVLRDGRVTDYELTAARPDGSTTVVSYSAATYADSQGKVQGMLASARDVTDRKRFEELQAGLLERAQKLDQAKSDFVSRISHELRSPLTSVLGYLELLGGEEGGQLTRQQRRMLEVVTRNGRRLLSLIEDLLLLSRIEAGAVSIDWEPVRLDTLVRASHRSYQPALRQGQLTSDLDLEPGLLIDGDTRQLERVVDSLISNAVKFTPPGGHVDISCRRAGGEVVIEVRDTGIGIPEEEQPQLFTRFFRSAMATEREAQGTGLGLFIVKHVTEAHGGSVAVSSAPGAGSTFTVRLPARAAEAPGNGGLPHGRDGHRGRRDREVMT